MRVGHVGIARNDPDFELAMLVNQILGGQFTSRLNEKLREEKGYTYGVRSHFDTRLGTGPFSISASLQSDKLADALDDIYHELHGPRRRPPPTQAELDDARRALIEGQTRQFETPPPWSTATPACSSTACPPTTIAGSPSGSMAIDLDALTAAASPADPPELPWSPWSSPTRPRSPSRSGDWDGPSWSRRGVSVHSEEIPERSGFLRPVERRRRER